MHEQLARIVKWCDITEKLLLSTKKKKILLGDKCIEKFHLGRYIVRYRSENFLYC